MLSGWWDSPVRVELGAGKAVNVNNNQQAAEVLLDAAWPDRNSARAVRAREAVLRAMERPDDPGPTIVAERAFIAAAEDANILLPELPKSMRSAGAKKPAWDRRKR